MLSVIFFCNRKNCKYSECLKTGIVSHLHIKNVQNNYGTVIQHAAVKNNVTSSTCNEVEPLGDKL
jgi:hypothetical protein